MGCTDNGAESDALYWSSRGINSQTRCWHCCGLPAGDDLRGIHADDCPMIADIRSGARSKWNPT